MSRVENLLHNLNSSDDYMVVIKAIKALVEFGDNPQVVDELISKLVQKEDLWVAIASSEVLLEINSPKAVSAFFEVLTSTSLEEELKHSSDVASIKGDYRGLFALAEHHGGDILYFKTLAAQALVKLNTEESLNALTQASLAEDPYRITAKAIELAIKQNKTTS